MRRGVHGDDWVETVGAVSAAATRGDASQCLMTGALLTNPFATTLLVSPSSSVDEGPGGVCVRGEAFGPCGSVVG